MLKASDITEHYDWTALLERLVGPTEEPVPVPQPVTLFPTLWD